MKILITSGGTKIPIDRVRSIINMSRGTFGAKLATQFLLRGHRVDFLHAEGSRSPMKFEANLLRMTPVEAMAEFAEVAQRYESFKGHFGSIGYKTFNDYVCQLRNLLRVTNYDMIILAAAVSDYGTEPLKGKARSSKKAMSIKLHALPKLIKGIKKVQPDTFLVGFKLLVDSTESELILAARDSIKKNHCDLVIANDLRDIQADNHTVHLVPDKPGDSPEMYKTLQSHGNNTLFVPMVVDLIERFYKERR